MAGSSSCADYLARTASCIDSDSALVQWVRGPLREVFRHQHALIATGSAHSLGITIDKTIGIDLPDSYVRGLRNAAGHIDSPLLVSWNIFRETVFFRPGGIVLDPQWAANFKKHELESGLLDGCGDAVSPCMTFLCLYNLPQPPEHLKAAFRAIAVLPVHRAVQRIYESDARRQHPAFQLTPAELEVLKWLQKGKTTEEIAQILAKSKLTVKTQIQHMLRKCGASSRFQLVQVYADLAKFREIP